MGKFIQIYYIFQFVMEILTFEIFNLFSFIRQRDHHLYLSPEREIMANQLVPFIQDEKKWTEHYMAQARKQIAATRVPQLKEFDNLKLYNLNLSVLLQNYLLKLNLS